MAETKQELALINGLYRREWELIAWIRKRKVDTANVDAQKGSE